MKRYLLKSEARFGYWTATTSPNPGLNPYYTMGTARDHRVILAPDINAAWQQARDLYPDLCVNERTLANGSKVANQYTVEEIKWVSNLIKTN